MIQMSALFLHSQKWLIPNGNFGFHFYELRNALMVVLPNLDIVKADLIVRTLFSVKQSHEGLAVF